MSNKKQLKKLEKLVKNTEKAFKKALEKDKKATIRIKWAHEKALEASNSLLKSQTAFDEATMALKLEQEKLDAQKTAAKAVKADTKEKSASAESTAPQKDIIITKKAAPIKTAIAKKSPASEPVVNSVAKQKTVARKSPATNKKPAAKL